MMSFLDWLVFLTGLGSAAFWLASAYASYEHREKSKLLGSARTQTLEDLLQAQADLALLNTFAAGTAGIAVLFAALKTVLWRTDFCQIGAYRELLASRINGLQSSGVVRGNIAIPDKDPKSWRSRGRKRKSAAALAVPTIIDGVKSPAEIKRDKRIRRLRELAR